MPWAAHRVAEQRDAIVAELERELENRAKVFPDRVSKGRMTEQEAGYQLAIWREILDNVAECLGAPHWHVQSIRFPWRDKVKALERELDYRLRLYPDWIGKGRIDQAAADRNLAIVEATRDLFHRHLFAFIPEPGPALDYVTALRAGPWSGGAPGAGAYMGEDLKTHPGRLALQDLTIAHIEMIDAADSNDQQQELQL